MPSTTCSYCCGGSNCPSPCGYYNPAITSGVFSAASSLTLNCASVFNGSLVVVRMGINDGVSISSVSAPGVTFTRVRAPVAQGNYQAVMYYGIAAGLPGGAGTLAVTVTTSANSSSLTVSVGVYSAPAGFYWSTSLTASAAAAGIGLNTDPSLITASAGSMGNGCTGCPLAITVIATGRNLPGGVTCTNPAGGGTVTCGNWDSGNPWKNGSIGDSHAAAPPGCWNSTTNGGDTTNAGMTLLTGGQCAYLATYNPAISLPSFLCQTPVFYGTEWSAMSALFCLQSESCGCSNLIAVGNTTGDTAPEWSFTMTGFTATPTDADGCAGTTYNGSWTVAWDGGGFSSSSNCYWQEQQYLNGAPGGLDCTSTPVNRWGLTIDADYATLSTPYRSVSYSLATTSFSANAANTLCYGTAGCPGSTPPAGLPSTLTITPHGSLCTNCPGTAPTTASFTLAGLANLGCADCTTLNQTYHLATTSACVFSGATGATCGGAGIVATLALQDEDYWTLTFAVGASTVAQYVFYGRYQTTMTFYYSFDDGSNCSGWPSTISVTYS